MYWQLLDNEKHVQCSESSSTTPSKENSTRDSSATSLTRTTSKFIKNLIYSTRKILLVPLENIKDVQCNIDQSRSGNLNSQERLPKLPRHVIISHLSSHNQSFALEQCPYKCNHSSS
jgi:hypothetical protein